MEQATNAIYKFFAVHVIEKIQLYPELKGHSFRGFKDDWLIYYTYKYIWLELIIDFSRWVNLTYWILSYDV